MPLLFTPLWANRTFSSRRAVEFYPAYVMRGKDHIDMLELGAVVCNVILEQIPEHPDASHLIGLTFMKLIGQKKHFHSSRFYVCANVIGLWVLDLGSRVFDLGSWVLSLGSWVFGHGSQVFDLGSWVLGLERLERLGSWVLRLERLERLAS